MRRTGWSLTALLPLLLLGLGTPSWAASYIVNSDDDDADLVPGNNSCDTGQFVIVGLHLQAECTLRAAIEEANAHAGADAIHFHALLPTTDGFVFLLPTSPYPSLTDTVSIDGSTAPGYAVSAPDAIPVVQINGIAAGTPFNGLSVASGASGSSILSLALYAFAGDGISLSGADAVKVQGCHLGVAEGEFYLGNGEHGIELRLAADDNRIGPDCGPSLGCVGRGNVISANAGDGIRISNGNRNEIGLNRIGTDVTGSTTSPPGTSSTGNAGEGLRIDIGSDNVIGVVQTVLPLPPGRPFEVAAGNVISGNGEIGIRTLEQVCTVTGSSRIQANRIGTDLAGTTSLPNKYGIHIATCDAVIGGPGLAPNLISGNTFSGISAECLGTTFPLALRNLEIVGNLVGVDAAGAAVIPNGYGMRLCAADSLIDANVVGGNEDYGIQLYYPEPSNTVTRNFVGTNAAGEDLGNAGPGIIALGQNVGAPDLGNVVGFNGTGIEMRSFGLLEGNYVGVSPSGDYIGNVGHGIVVTSGLSSSFPNEIGSGPGAHNTVGFNAQDGIRVESDSFAVIRGNRIGVSEGGAAAGNEGSGVYLDDDCGGVVGAELGAATPELDGNEIAYNGSAGVVVAASCPNADGVVIRANSLHDNAAIGIDLGAEGPTADDVAAADADAGPNALQNTPEIDPSLTAYDSGSDLLSIRYRVMSSPAASLYPLTIDFYLADGSADEGEVWLGSDFYDQADAQLWRDVVIVPPVGVTVLGALRATATDASSVGATSEFGHRVAVPEPGLLAGLAAGFALLRALERRRRRAYLSRRARGSTRRLREPAE